MGSFLSNLGASIIGNPKKAFLILHKNAEATEKLNSSKIAAETAAKLDMLGAAGGTVGSAAVSAVLGNQYHVLQVQYNPSTISIQSNAAPVPFQYMQQGLDCNMPVQQMQDPKTTLSVELIFDAVNNKDAFMFEKMRISAGDAVSAVSGAIKSFKGGYTVQPQTNGLVGMIMRDSTRTVTFKWAEMTFTGEVMEVQARYTMFSVSGKPIRSVVRLNIVQNVESNADATYWDNAFDKCFGDSYVAKDSGGKSAADVAQNLLNISF